MEAWAAEVVKQTVETPIYLTYNFFLTAIGIPALGFWLSRLIKTKDKLQSEYWQTWQEGAKARNSVINEKLERIEKCIGGIKDDIKERVHINHCHDQHSAVKEDIKELRSKIYT